MKRRSGYMAVNDGISLLSLETGWICIGDISGRGIACIGANGWLIKAR